MVQEIFCLQINNQQSFNSIFGVIRVDAGDVSQLLPDQFLALSVNLIELPTYSKIFSLFHHGMAGDKKIYKQMKLLSNSSQTVWVFKSKSKYQNQLEHLISVKPQ